MSLIPVLKYVHSAFSPSSSVYITYDVWIFIELIIIFFLFVETGGKTLEETAALLDGEEAAGKLEENAKQAAKQIAVHIGDEKGNDTHV